MKREKRPQVVMITGASAGIGRATAQAFAKRQACIGLLARGREGLEGAKMEVEKLVEMAAEKLDHEFGPIDIWVNNAMASVFSPIMEMTAAEYRRVTEVTYLGYVWGTLAALHRMRPRKRGVIVHVGSALAYRGIPLQSAYCAAKHAILGFTDSLRCELIHEKSNIHVCMVEMPAVNTPQFAWVKNRLPHQAQPVPPIYQPEVAAEAIVFAATHRRRKIYVGTPTVMAIIANKTVPAYLDHYLARTGYDSQQTDKPKDPNQPDNLWSPVPKDFGAHGAFDGQARKFSFQLWLDINRPLYLMIILVITAAIVAFLVMHSQSQRREEPKRETSVSTQPVFEETSRRPIMSE